MAEYVDANPNQLDNRTIFQSTLLHIAARNGQLQVAQELLNRGIDVNALDYVSLSSPQSSSASLLEKRALPSCRCLTSPCSHRQLLQRGLHCRALTSSASCALVQSISYQHTMVRLGVCMLS